MPGHMLLLPMVPKYGACGACARIGDAMPAFTKVCLAASVASTSHCTTCAPVMVENTNPTSKFSMSKSTPSSLLVMANEAAAVPYAEPVIVR